MEKGKALNIFGVKLFYVLKKIMPFILIVFLCFLALNVDFSEDVGGAEIRVPQNYPSIQEAVNGASAGDTILVAPGVYEENVIVNKSLRIVGEATNTTIVDSGGFSVVSANVSIENFTVRNSVYGIRVKNVENVTIQKNIATNNTFGIFLENSSNCLIKNNTVTNNYGGHPDLRIGGGIYLRDSNSSKVIGNYLTKNINAICLEKSHNNIIIENEVVKNKEPVYGWGWGIDLSDSNSNLIDNNTCYSNPEGITLYSCYNNTIKKNLLFDNWGCGIGIIFSTRNVYEMNFVFNNSVGITMEKTCDIFVGNSIFNNTKGISIHFSNSSIFYRNILINNTVHVPKDVYPNVNNWDNGFEGNHWSNYTGVDLDMNAIGDTPHVLDELNMDTYPLMAPINIFDAGVWNDTQQQIHVISNSTITNFQLNKTQAKISFNVTGDTPTIGFCRVTIPNVIIQEMWNNNYTVLVDDTEPVLMKNWTDDKNTHIYLTYQHSEHTVTIIPEIPLNTLLITILIITTISVFYKEKPKH